MINNPIVSSRILQVQSWDLNWCLRLNKYSADRNIAVFFKGVSRLGDGWFWYALGGGIALAGGAAAGGVVLQAGLTSAVGVGIYKLLKKHTLRPRPYQVHQAVVLGERPLDHFSFPSGHTLHAVLFTIMLGSHFPVLLPLLVPFMLLVAMSRVVLGLHYPTDVFAGATLGALLASVSLLFW